jgi:peroxiredoxin
MSRVLRASRRRAPSAAATLVLALALLAGAGCEHRQALVGGAAPEFSLSDLGGKAVRLANLKGRVVFLNVWATWCEPCREEMPSMESLYQRLHGPDFEMLAVNADQGDRAVVERFVREHGLTFPVLPDPDLQIADRYRVTGYPETFLIDRNGRIVGHEIGPRDWDSPESHAAFRRLLERGEWAGL